MTLRRPRRQVTSPGATGVWHEQRHRHLRPRHARGRHHRRQRQRTRVEPTRASRPQVKLISLKIGDETGGAQRVGRRGGHAVGLRHRDEYNIRVVNLSVNSTAEQSYHTSPLDAAAEILWFNGIVVVASAGNKMRRYLVQHRQRRAGQRSLRHHRGRHDEAGTSSTSDDWLARLFGLWRHVGRHGQSPISSRRAPASSACSRPTRAGPSSIPSGSC